MERQHANGKAEEGIFWVRRVFSLWLAGESVWSADEGVRNRCHLHALLCVPHVLTFFFLVVVEKKIPKA